MKGSDLIWIGSNLNPRIKRKGWEASGWAGGREWAGEVVSGPRGEVFGPGKRKREGKRRFGPVSR